MADESEDTLDSRLESLQRRAENLRELLREGDEVTVALDGGDLFVEESFRSKFERQHAKVFGRMLAVEEQLKTGTFPYFLGLAAFTLVVIGLQLSWWDVIIGEAAVNLINGWWFYLLAPVAILYLINEACGLWRKTVFRRNRRELLDLIAADGLDRDVMLVMLRDQDDLDNIVYHLKLDAK